MSIHTVLTHCKTTATASPLTDHIPSFSACVCVCVCVCGQKHSIVVYHQHQQGMEEPAKKSVRQASISV